MTSFIRRPPSWDVTGKPNMIYFYDWVGRQMDDELYTQLAGMHGSVRIKIYQTKLMFPFFVVGYGQRAPLHTNASYGG